MLKDRPVPSEADTKSLLRVLALAHRKMDELGYPPAPPKPLVRDES